MNKIEDTQMEQWWKENGGESWRREMESPLRAGQEHYKKQVVLIDKVFGRILSLVDAPTISVLEVGCGYGRVISFLRDRFSDFDVWGIDQSEAMLAEAIKQGFDKSKLHLGNVRALEPKPKFSVVYTSEMLIHIHPNAILDALRNIKAKASKYVVHIENSPIADLYQKSSAEHSGCWRHSFVSLYQSLGLEVEVISQEGTKHSGYIIRL